MKTPDAVLFLLILTPLASAQQAATPGGGTKLTSRVRQGPTAPLTSSALCAGSLVDQGGTGCLKASTVPTLGALHPLSPEFNVNTSGQVGVGTTAPAANKLLHVEGMVQFGINNQATGLNSSMLGGQNNTASGSGSVVAGGSTNRANGHYANVGGGMSNSATGPYSVVAGGNVNSSLGHAACVGGGLSNQAGGDEAFIGAGVFNDAGGDLSTIAGGYDNDASGARSTISGGDFNIASGFLATIPGGRSNLATGDYSLAAGREGQAIHDGSFVWSDSTTTSPFVGPFTSTGTNQFLVRATGGIGLGTNNPLARLHVEGSTGEDVLRVRIAGQTRLMVAANGATSIGANIGQPTFDLQVSSGGTFGGTAGKPGGGSWSVSSDRRLKRDVAELEGALERLLALRGVTYEYIEPDLTGEAAGEHTGMIAQDVQRVFPEWVHAGPDGYLRLTFQGFEALTVEALRDLRAEKDAELAQLREELAGLRTLVERMQSPASPR